MHKGESLCCFQDSASVTYGGMLPSDLTLSALRFILSAKSGQSCKQDCETVDFCNRLFLCLYSEERREETSERLERAYPERALIPLLEGQLMARLKILFESFAQLLRYLCVIDERHHLQIDL